MLDALLKSKFYTRSKSEIKTTKKRIELIMRKRMAMEKFLRNDVADLIKNDLDSNAYSRVEQLYADQNLSSCYEFVDQSCLLILSHLSAMDKSRECPEECKEAVSTLMFAAARFADLPELRELRSLFGERYGNYLEPYVNQEFVKNLKADPPSKEIKLRMMQEIALDCGIQWDPISLDLSRYAAERNNESRKPHHQNGLETETVKSYSKSEAQVEKKEEEKHDHGHRRVSPYWSSNSSSCGESTASPEYSTDSASEDMGERKLFGFRSMAPPPYIKTYTSKSQEKVTQSQSNLQSGSKDMAEGRSFYGFRSMAPTYIKTDSTSKLKSVDSNLQLEDESAKAIPRSMRIRRPLKPVPSVHEKNDHKDEEETKPSYNGRKPLNHGGREVPAPARTGSLPAETSTATEERKGFARAATYSSGMSPRGHVHPKLPDYDDFVARLAALRASS